MFVKNVNATDSIVRVVLGLVILSLAFIGPQTPWAYVGIILIATGFIRFCPLYRIVGLSTCKRRE
ncbi:MAG: YgaP family membrane protein [Cellvibrionaceae bacterium]